MTLALDGRLLCAARDAYDITTTGTVHLPSSPVGWRADPICYVGGPSDIDACLIGETDSEVIVAFRGTEPVNAPDRRQALFDWANDLNCPLVKDPNLPGLVHAGFAHSVAALWAQLWPQLRVIATAFPVRPLYVTGHSKGGALAPLAAMRMAAEGLKPRVVTFAGARCGEAMFARAYGHAVPDGTRYEYADDVVPHLPPNEAVSAMLATLPGLTALPVLGYVSVGALKFINWDGVIVGESPALELQRAARLAERIVTGDFSTILADHYLDPGSGYAKAILGH